MSGPYPSTDGNAVPPLDPELADLFDDLQGYGPGIDQIRSGLLYIALERHTLDQTQTLIAGLAGGADGINVIALIARVLARLATPDSNPPLRQLPLDQQKHIQRAGEITQHNLTDPALADLASEICAAIQTH